MGAKGAKAGIVKGRRKHGVKVLVATLHYSLAWWSDGWVIARLPSH